MEKSSLVSLTDQDLSLANVGIVSERVQKEFPDLTLDTLKALVEAGEYTKV